MYGARGRSGGLPPYYVSIVVSRPVGLDDETLIRLFHEAAERAACIPIEIKPAGMVIEAEAASLQILGSVLRDLLGQRGCQLERLTATRI
jgi:hypothetical protein